MSAFNTNGDTNAYGVAQNANICHRGICGPTYTPEISEDGNFTLTDLSLDSMGIFQLRVRLAVLGGGAVIFSESLTFWRASEAAKVELVGMPDSMVIATDGNLRRVVAQRSNPWAYVSSNWGEPLVQLAPMQWSIEMNSPDVTFTVPQDKPGGIDFTSSGSLAFFVALPWAGFTPSYLG